MKQKLMSEQRPMWTPEFEAFVAPARRKPQIWRLLVGGLIIAFCWAVGTFGTFALGGLVGVLNGLDPQEMERDLLAGNSPFGTLLVLVTFTGLFLGVILAGKVHSRSVQSLFGDRQAWPFVLGFGAIAAVSLLSLVFPTELEIVPNLATRTFLTLLPFTIFFLLIQTGAEELLFRGYLQTQLAARFRSPIVWMFLPGLLFGALHYAPSEFGPNAIYVVAAITLVGWLTADLTRVTGGIGAAWGLHFANNAGGIILVGSPGPLGGLALYRQTTQPDDPVLAPLLAVQIGFLIVAWLLCRLWIAKSQRAVA
ncbi:MAG: CPBP family glutamic-type intramembrane protease [Pseudomonadota bacterium]